jgi:hypothetical protein
LDGHLCGGIGLITGCEGTRADRHDIPPGKVDIASTEVPVFFTPDNLPLSGKHDVLSIEASNVGHVLRTVPGEPAGGKEAKE